MNECIDCGFWEPDYQACICPHSDKWYACPLEPEPSEDDFKTEEELRREGKIT